MPAPPPLEWKKSYEEGPYAWTSAYAARKGSSSVDIEIRIHLRPEGGVGKGACQIVRTQAETAFSRYFDQRFVLTDPQGQTYALRMGLRWVSAAADSHVSVCLHPKAGADEPTHWFLEAPPIHRAHELGHVLGLRDEYRDPAIPNRAAPGAPGIFTDHSLMGHYLREGEEEADLRLRHGEQIAADLGALFGETFSVAPSPHYLVRPGDSLGWIAARYYGAANQWPRLYQANREEIGDYQRLTPGLQLSVPNG
ncbi:MAG: LysM domain-containing protein [Bacteroidetes bacterium]|nr:MAG: LysM domain-containing protein [Bacteroidota bacterium]